jgi:hypothetical protein
MDSSLSLRLANSLAAFSVAIILAGPASAMPGAMGSGFGEDSHQSDFRSAGRADGPRRGADTRRIASTDGARRNARANAFHNGAGDAEGLHGLAGPHDGDRFHGGFVHDGEPWRNEAFADHRWIGPFLDQVRESGPVGLLFAPHYYGDGDFQYCMRRDVYGDLYQGC